MELLVRPLRQSPPRHEHVLDFLANFPNLRTVPIDLPIAQEAASVRAMHRLAPADALTVATGLIHQVAWLITNDHDWAARLAPIQARIGVGLLSRFLPFPEHGCSGV